MDVLRGTTDLLIVILALVLIPLWFSSPVLDRTSPSCQCADEVRSGSGSLYISKYSSLAKIKDSSELLLGVISLSTQRTLDTLKLQPFERNCINVLHESDGNISHRLSSDKWYGGPQYYTARWPLSKENVQYQHYVSDDLLLHPGRFGSILERYWLSSSGIAVYFLHDNLDLYYGVENGDILLGSSSGLINYLICKHGTSLTDTHKYVIRTFFKKPSKLPDTTIMRHPIWSTWVRYKTKINESVILSFAQEIRDNGFESSQLEIDDTYTTNYGDMEFDLTRFPKPQQMLSKLKEMNYRVTSWIHPFVNFDTKSFQEGVVNNYLVKDRVRNVTGLMKWWQGTGAIIDFYSPSAQQWYIKKLKTFQRLGIDSFKFDGGEYIYMPADMEYNPNLLTQEYVNMASEYGGMVETRAAYRNQDSNIYLRMMDKHSYWGFENGLRSMIPSALHLSIIGYHFILPDMIGGNAMVEDVENLFKMSEIPEKELYIRWFQLVTFLQSMQISISPWQYDEETTSIALEMTKLHEEYVAPLIISIAEQTILDGTPIIRPLWWNFPLDLVTLDIEDQFMIGDTLLVAPVVEKGVDSRRIYLPEGVWLDMSDKGREYLGAQWIQYPVNIRTVPHFQLKQN